MRRALVLSMVGLGMWTPAAGASHDSSVCADSRNANVQAWLGTQCIPLAAAPWRKYQMAAIYFWWRQNPPSPITVQNGPGENYCCNGDNGGWAYPLPYWCKDVPSYHYYPHGVTNVIGTYGVTHTWKLGEPPQGSSDPYGGESACSIVFTPSLYNEGPTRNKCITYLHEWGHLLGWSHRVYSSVIMDVTATPPPSAGEACRAYGM